MKLQTSQIKQAVSCNENQHHEGEAVKNDCLNQKGSCLLMSLWTYRTSLNFQQPIGHKFEVVTQ